MNENCLTRMREHIFSLPVGEVFALSDFVDMGSYDSVRQNLTFLTEKQVLRRLCVGVYQSIFEHDVAVPSPVPLEFAKGIARNNDWLIYPGTEEARYQLGLSMYPPTEFVWASTGPTGTYTFRDVTVKLVKNQSKFMTPNSPEIALVSLALCDLDKYKITAENVYFISNMMTDDNKKCLLRDLALAPVRLRPVIELICDSYGRAQRI